MAKILVVYYSQSGNTEKMASAIAEGAAEVAGVDVEVKSVQQVNFDDLIGADGIIMGSPTYYGQMCSQLKALIDQTTQIHGRLRGKVGGAFTSSGGIASGAETTLLSIVQAMLIHGMIVEGRYDNAHYGVAAVGEPHTKETEMCRKLGKRVAELAAKLKS